MSTLSQGTCSETCIADTGARSAGLSDLFARFGAGIRHLAARRARRAVFRDMARLDDRMLDDIGFTRAEVETAAGLPLEVNASLAVRHMAAERRAAESRLRRR